jgi:hypothetical protein
MKLYRDGIEEVIDGRPKVKTTREGHIVECYKVGGKPRFFVTLAGTHYCAHGETLAEAISDAVWKDERKRPSLESLKEGIRAVGRDRKITLNEFRVLTGACLYGCREALASKGLQSVSSMTADDIAKHFPDWGEKLLVVLEWDK